MATKMSTKVGLCTHFSVSGNWMKQCLSCLKYYFTLSLPFEQRLVFRLRCDVQNVVSIILKSVRNIDLSWDFFFFFTSCHKWAVYADRANTSLRAPVVRRLVPNELPCHTRHGALICTLLHVQPSLHAIDCFWQTHCDEMLISSIELGLAKKLHQLFLHLIFLYLSLFLPSSISVVRCCYESSFRKITRDVRFLGKRVNTKTQTFQSGNHERVELVLLLRYSWGSIGGCCILMLKWFYTCS